MPRTKELTETSPNEGLGLEEIDYQNLVGENFKKYQEIEAKLFLNQNYDFEERKATIVTKFRTNEDTGATERYISGISIKDAQPIMRTRITWKAARDLNAFADNKATSKYFLLAK